MKSYRAADENGRNIFGWGQIDTDDKFAQEFKNRIDKVAEALAPYLKKG